MKWVRACGVPNYMVSDTGLVKNTKTDKALKFYEVNGYWKVKLWKDGYQHKIRVNRLVKMSFHYREDHSSMDVDHIDFDRKNNNLSNLRWSQPKRNRSRKNV